MLTCGLPLGSVLNRGSQADKFISNQRGKNDTNPPENSLHDLWKQARSPAIAQSQHFGKTESSDSHCGSGD